MQVLGVLVVAEVGQHPASTVSLGYLGGELAHDGH